MHEIAIILVVGANIYETREFSVDKTSDKSIFQRRLDLNKIYVSGQSGLAEMLEFS